MATLEGKGKTGCNREKREDCPSEGRNLQYLEKRKEKRAHLPQY